MYSMQQKRGVRRGAAAHRQAEVMVVSCPAGTVTLSASLTARVRGTEPLE